MFGEVNYLMKFKSINVDVNYHTSAGLGLPLRLACDFLCPGVGVSNGRPLLMTSIRLKGHLERAGVGRGGFCHVTVLAVVEEQSQMGNSHLLPTVSGINAK